MAQHEERRRHELAELGAHHRLLDIRAEEQEILRMFPSLGTAKRTSWSLTTEDGEAQPDSIRRRKPMTAIQKAAISTRMTKYWAGKKRRPSATAK